MNSPYYVGATMLEIIKKNLIIKEIAVDIMDMDYVGIDFLKPFYELSGCPCGPEAVTVEGAREEAMKCRTPLVTNRNDIGGA